MQGWRGRAGLSGMVNARGLTRWVQAGVSAAALMWGLAACGDDADDGGDAVDEAVEAGADGNGGEDDGDGAAVEVTAPTIDELLDREAPLNIAHAGGDAEWPHSTPYAFSESVAAGADMLEMDVWLSADGVVMVHHDETVDRITEAEGPVGDFTVEELRELDAAYWFEPGHGDGRDVEQATYPLRGVRTGEVDPPEGYEPDDFIIPTLAEVAERFPDMPLNIEIKGEGEVAAGAAAALAEELEALDRLDTVVVASFDQPTVDVFRDLAPTVPVSPGVDDMMAWYTGEGDLGDYRVLQLPPRFGDTEVVTGENLDRLRDEHPGIHVWVWMNTFAEDTGENYQSYLDLGVDGIITARPSEFPG